MFAYRMDHKQAVIVHPNYKIIIIYNEYYDVFPFLMEEREIYKNEPVLISKQCNTGIDLSSENSFQNPNRHFWDVVKEDAKGKKLGTKSRSH